MTRRTFRWCAAALALVWATPGNARSSACDTGTFALRADFPGARLSVCEVIDANQVLVSIQPEDGGRINPSPWYGFHVRRHGGRPNAELTLRLQYGEHKHRYAPKISSDGKTWRFLPAAAARLDGNDAVLTLQPDANGFFVSAGENLNNDYYARWRAQTQRLAGGATWFEIGQSLGGRPIHALIVNPQARDYVLLIGRQHPPEVTGALAMMRFVERLLELRAGACATDPARCRFLARHAVVVVPLLNPDGVAAGHWRHNLDSTDLNRDWGDFRQPETLAVRDLVDRFERQRRRPRVVLDFHSTRRNVLFTQDAKSPTRPPAFAARWLNLAQRADELYAVENAPRRLSESGTAKNYFYRRFGIPSITFEVADEEDRALIARSAVAFADALVDVLAAADDAPPPRCADFFCHMARANAASLIMLAEAKLLTSQEASRVADAAAWVVEEQARPNAARAANYLAFERRLTELVGVQAANVHMGRSRQDLHGTARRMLARDEWLELLRGALRARAVIIDRAASEADTPVPAYTHGVQAQPTTFGHYLLAFSAALRRDGERLIEGYQRLNRSPLGASVLGTSGFPLRRERLAELLGFAAPVENSYDANLVSPAHYRLELAGALTASAVVIGQFAQNLHTQYHNPRPWLVLGATSTSGSSSMPQKRNPRPIDRLRSAASLTVAKAHALVLLTHNANTGMHDYRQFAPLAELIAQSKELYRRYAALVDSLEVDGQRAAEELARGYSTMTEVADVLLREAKVPFRTAHAYASALTDLCRASGRPALALTDGELRDTYFAVVKERLPVAPGVIRAALDPATLIAERRGLGGPQPAEMARSLQAHRQNLAAQQRWLTDRQAALAHSRQALRVAFNQLRMDTARTPP